MTFTHANALNNYGPAKFIVATSAANGTHTTLASAMAVASVGDTIILRDSVTENVTITPGVNINGWIGSSLNTPSITGTLTMTGAGTSTLQGLTLITNSAALIAVTGSAASILNVTNCYLNCTNTTGITFSVANTSSQININNCIGDIGTTGIGLFSHSSTGMLLITNSRVTNSGGSSTASTCSAGTLNLINFNFGSPITTSGTGAIGFANSQIDSSGQNATCLTLGGSGGQFVRYSRLISGSASTVSISSSASLELCEIQSSNTNAITGAGTLTGNSLQFTGTSTTVNTTTVATQVFGITGTWTPNIQINAVNTGITYTTQVGGYTVLGNIVCVWANIVLSSKGASSGVLSISNFPIATSTNGGNQVLSIPYFSGWTSAGYTSMGLQANTSSQQWNFNSSGTGLSPTLITNTTITNTFSVRFNAVYIID
jgi:hypothetical protein